MDTIKIIQVCAKCGDELGTAGFRYINGTRYCGPCARILRNPTQFKMRDNFTTKGGYTANMVDEFGRTIGAVVQRWPGHSEAWPNWPHGPCTTHPGRLDAVRELRRLAREVEA